MPCSTVWDRSISLRSAIFLSSPVRNRFPFPVSRSPLKAVFVLIVENQSQPLPQRHRATEKTRNGRFVLGVLCASVSLWWVLGFKLLNYPIAKSLNPVLGSALIRLNPS